MAKVIPAWVPPLGVAVPALYAFVLGAVVLGAWGGLLPARLAAWMNPATAAGIALAGIAMLARVSRMHWRSRLAFAPAAIAVLGAVGVAAHLAAADAAAPTSLASGLALLLTAALLVVHDRPRNRGEALLVQLLVGLLLALGIVSLVTQDVSPEGLVQWYRFSRRMQPAAATGFIAIAIALMALVARSPWYLAIYARREDEKIVVLVLGILCLMAVTMGAAAFVAMQRDLEQATRAALMQAVADRAGILANVVSDRVTRASMVATRSGMATMLREAQRSRDADSRTRLALEAASHFGAGFTRVAIFDAAGNPLAHAGEAATQPELELPLAGLAAPVDLLWQDGFVLRVRYTVWGGLAPAGFVEAEQVLPSLTQLHLGTPALGRTAEWLLCGRDGARVACFPHRRTRQTELIHRDDGASPIELALTGARGIASGIGDDGTPVIAAYAPVGYTGLGVVLRMETDEFYAPLRDKLGLWWRWYFAVALAGVLLVASQVRPVAQRLVRSEATARRRSEVLARSERALRELYTALADGILVLRPDGTIEFANPAAGKIFGFAPEQLVGRPVSSLMPEELREANARATRRFLEEGTSNVIGRGDLVFPAIRSDGSPFDLEFSLARMREGDELRLVTVLRDVSARTALDRMKSEFIAAVSHELRTPLTSVMGSLELLREEARLDGPERELLEMAWRNSQRLSLLVNDILDAERIQSGALRFETATFALEPFLEEALRLNEGYAGAQHASLRLERPVPDSPVVADRDRLMQVMANLLSNALKFSPDGGEVLVRARSHDGRVRVEVHDRGRGLPEAFRARAFEKFAQADSSDAREKGGTGLGLAISKAIVDRLGGAIGFEDRPGGGTTFWFEVPGAR
jgi:PAS domain S-box-containing protein